MQNEKYFYDHYNEFEYNQDYVKFVINSKNTFIYVR